MWLLMSAAFAAPCVWEGSARGVSVTFPAMADTVTLDTHGEVDVVATLGDDGALAVVVTGPGARLVGQAAPDAWLLGVLAPIDLPGGLSVEADGSVRVAPVAGGVAVRPRLPGGYAPIADPVVVVGCEAVAVEPPRTRFAPAPTASFVAGEHAVRETPEGPVVGRFSCASPRACADVRVVGVEGGSTHVLAQSRGAWLDGWVDTAALGELVADRSLTHSFVLLREEPTTRRVTCRSTPLELVRPNGEHVVVGALLDGTELEVADPATVTARLPWIGGPTWPTPLLVPDAATACADRGAR